MPLLELEIKFVMVRNVKPTWTYCCCDDFVISTACPVGTYRSSRDTTCLSCPANTLTNQVATRQCQCKIGYFRNNVRVDSTCSSYLSASNERAGNQCTRKRGPSLEVCT